MKKLFKLSNTRVWRTYEGGKRIGEWLGENNPNDSNYPELWVGSIVRAKNPHNIENEGLSLVEDKTLLDIINSNPNYYLGENHVKKYGANMGMLVKFIDSLYRLTVQVHPTKEFARTYFNSDYGKTEAWYILKTREVNSEKPYVYLGFKEGINKELWKKYFDNQDIENMLKCLNKVEVKAGDVYFIEGGVPHAIGCGCFLLEVQEPTDFTIRTERVTPEGLEIHDSLIHQGLGFDRMFDCFNYDEFSIEETLKKWKLEPKIVKTDEFILKTLLDKMFLLEEIEVCKKYELVNNGYKIMVIYEGSGVINNNGEIYNVVKGDLYFVSNYLEKLTIEGNLKVIVTSLSKND